MPWWIDCTKASAARHRVRDHCVPAHRRVPAIGTVRPAPASDRLKLGDQARAPGYAAGWCPAEGAFFAIGPRSMPPTMCRLTHSMSTRSGALIERHLPRGRPRPRDGPGRGHARPAIHASGRMNPIPATPGDGGDLRPPEHCGLGIRPRYPALELGVQHEIRPWPVMDCGAFAPEISLMRTRNQIARRNFRDGTLQAPVGRGRHLGGTNAPPFARHHAVEPRDTTGGLWPWEPGDDLALCRVERRARHHAYRYFVQ